MFVVGGTKPEIIHNITKNAPDFFFLVPGFGTQGGDLDKIFNVGKNKDIGLLVNCSGKILYANDSKDLQILRKICFRNTNKKMQILLKKSNFI